MQNPELNRRDFQRLTLAAIGGLAVGAAAPRLAAADEGKSLLEEPHVCRGLNTCQNKGGCGQTKGKNVCAGQGGCATAQKHDCKAQNTCKGQGGCGENPGQNTCKAMGGCAVPLSNDAWAKARAHFEAAMKKAGKSVGPAPKKS